MEVGFRSDLTYEELLEIADNFSEENYIGPFRFGKVYRGFYRGVWPNQPVTVKIWDTSSSVVRDNEMRIMREIIFLRHERVKRQPAVAELSGCLFDGEHVAVMYYLNALDTLGRQLPEDTSLILLDVDYVPKLFEFDMMTGGGVAPKKPQQKTKYRQSADERNDVFAFGVLLLSLISKKSIKKEEVTPQFGGSLLGNAVSSFSHVHASLACGPYFYGSDGEEISRLAMECLNSSPDERPTMKQVTRRLEKLQLVQNHADLMEIKPRSEP